MDSDNPLNCYWLPKNVYHIAMVGTRTWRITVPVPQHGPLSLHMSKLESPSNCTIGNFCFSTVRTTAIGWYSRALKHFMVTALGPSLMPRRLQGPQKVQQQYSLVLCCRNNMHHLSSSFSKLNTNCVCFPRLLQLAYSLNRRHQPSDPCHRRARWNRPQTSSPF